MPHRLGRSWAAFVLSLGPGPLLAAEIAIQHQAPGCFLAEAFPRISAVITPADLVVRARVLFRPEAAPLLPPRGSATTSLPPARGQVSDIGDHQLDGGIVEAPATAWYAVAMAREGDAFVAVLPRPRTSARKVHYAIEVTDVSAASLRGREQVVEVVGSEGACGDKGVAESVASANVVVEVPPGAPLLPPVPLGFSPVGASAVAGSLDLVKKGSGKKALLLTLGGVGLAAGAAASLGSSAERTPAGDPGPPRDVTLNFSSPGRGATISVSKVGLVVALSILVREHIPVVTVRARIYNSRFPTQTCATMRGTYTYVRENVHQNVLLSGFESATPCGAVDRMHVSVEDETGRVVLATGTPSLPDIFMSMTFVP